MVNEVFTAAQSNIQCGKARVSDAARHAQAVQACAGKDAIGSSTPSSFTFKMSLPSPMTVKAPWMPLRLPPVAGANDPTLTTSTPDMVVMLVAGRGPLNIDAGSGCGIHGRNRKCVGPTAQGYVQSRQTAICDSRRPKSSQCSAGQCASVRRCAAQVVHIHGVRADANDLQRAQEAIDIPAGPRRQ